MDDGFLTDWNTNYVSMLTNFSAADSGRCNISWIALAGLLFIIIHLSDLTINYGYQLSIINLVPSAKLELCAAALNIQTSKTGPGRCISRIRKRLCLC